MKEEKWEILWNCFGNKSSVLDDLLNDNDRCMVTNHNQYMNYGLSAIAEIIPIDFREIYENVMMLSKLPFKKTKMNHKQFIDAYISAFSNAVEQIWDINKFHVI